MHYLAPFSYLLLIASTLLPSTLANAIPREVETLVARELSLNPADTTEVLLLAKQDFHCANELKQRSLDERGILDKRADPYDVLSRGLATCVDMTSLDYVRFTQNGYGIGTLGLCGCAALVITSNVGAIVAHISPGTTGLDSQLTAIQNLFNQHAADLAGAVVYLFPPQVNGNLVVPAFPTYIKNFILNNLRLGTIMKAYEQTANIPENARHGVLLVNVVGGALSIYLDGTSIPTR